jgi:hypothetical protein
MSAKPFGLRHYPRSITMKSWLISFAAIACSLLSFSVFAASAQLGQYVKKNGNLMAMHVGQDGQNRLQSLAKRYPDALVTARGDRMFVTLGGHVLLTCQALDSRFTQCTSQE